jgi:hypothetical protein
LVSNASLYSYELATGVRSLVATFGGGAAWPASPTALTIDHQGALYLADMAGTNQVRLVQFTGVPGSPAIAVSAGCGHTP